MTMAVQVLFEARAELIDAVTYYEGELDGLGRRLWDEVDEHVQWIIRNHEVPRLRESGYRRVNLKIFPYYLAYIVRGSTIWILAIAHSHKHPEYWIDRKKSAG